MNDKEVDAIKLLTKLKINITKKNNINKKNKINKIKKNILNFITSCDILTQEFIIEYFKNYNVLPTEKNIFKIIKLQEVLSEMKNNNIIECISSETEINSIFSFNTIIVKDKNKWSERLICLGNEFISRKKGKPLHCVYELINTLGFFAVRKYSAIGTGPCSKNLQSTKYIINLDRMINNAYRIGRR